MNVVASSRYSYTLSDHKSSKIYLFKSSLMLPSNEEIVGMAILDDSFSIDYKHLELEQHKYDPYTTVFTIIPQNILDNQEPQSYSLTFSVTKDLIVCDGISMQRII